VISISLFCFQATFFFLMDDLQRQQLLEYARSPIGNPHLPSESLVNCIFSKKRGVIPAIQETANLLIAHYHLSKSRVVHCYVVRIISGFWLERPDIWTQMSVQRGRYADLWEVLYTIHAELRLCPRPEFYAPYFMVYGYKAYHLLFTKYAITLGSANPYELLPLYSSCSGYEAKTMLDFTCVYDTCILPGQDLLVQSYSRCLSLKDESRLGFSGICSLDTNHYDGFGPFWIIASISLPRPGLHDRVLSFSISISDPSDPLSAAVNNELYLGYGGPAPTTPRGQMWPLRSHAIFARNLLSRATVTNIELNASSEVVDIGVNDANWSSHNYICADPRALLRSADSLFFLMPCRGSIVPPSPEMSLFVSSFKIHDAAVSSGSTTATSI
jgi:hypothetical protein